MQSLLAGLWVKACEKAGLIAVNDEKLVDAFMQHGVDVKEDVDCGDYLASKTTAAVGGLPKSYRRPPARRAGPRACIRITSWFARLLVIESVTSSMCRP